MPPALRPSLPDRFAGCLLGGAVGDALGAPVEFSDWPTIQADFGEAGIQDYAPAYGRRGAITDDTQLTLFTAEGLIRARNRFLDRGTDDVAPTLHRAYERWLLTQLGIPRRVPWDPELGERSNSGWLITQEFLHRRRAPGITCLSALQDGYRLATPKDPINDNKGCGGVMRVAPIGLVSDEAFDLGCDAAALTHGYPAAWLAAGAFADIIAQVVKGRDLRFATEKTLARCQAHHQGEEVAAALERAIDLSNQIKQPAPRDVGLLGEGWVAEEALAISVLCALTASDFRRGVLTAVNHSGDTDSTGSITGNLLGTSLGVGAIDEDLLNGLEGRPVIQQVAADLYAAFEEGAGPDLKRYPPW
jgi:ADP-ribosylglycohydrolase